MMTRLNILAVAILLMCSACVSAGTKAAKDTSVISRIEEGKSTRADVSALLGYPIVASREDREVTWQYFYTTAAPDATAFVPVVKAFTPNLYETTLVLSVTFNRDGTVKSLAREQIPLPLQQVDLSGKKG